MEPKSDYYKVPGLGIFKVKKDWEYFDPNTQKWKPADPQLTREVAYHGFKITPQAAELHLSNIARFALSCLKKIH